MLKATADRISACLRKTDHVFRLGGDEFTVVVTNLHEGLDVAKVVEKIRAEISSPITIKGHELQVETSIGISVFPMDGREGATLVKNADLAMYTAKEAGGGYRFFTPEMNRARPRNEWNSKTICAWP